MLEVRKKAPALGNRHFGGNLVHASTICSCSKIACTTYVSTGVECGYPWVSSVGILPQNETYVLKPWVFLDTMKPTFKGGMKGGSQGCKQINYLYLKNTDAHSFCN